MLGDRSPLSCRLVSVELSLAAAAPRGPAELSAFSPKGAVSRACSVLERDRGYAQPDIICFVLSPRT